MNRQLVLVLAAVVFVSLVVFSFYWGMGAYYRFLLPYLVLFLLAVVALAVAWVKISSFNRKLDILLESKKAALNDIKDSDYNKSLGILIAGSLVLVLSLVYFSGYIFPPLIDIPIYTNAFDPATGEYLSPYDLNSSFNVVWSYNGLKFSKELVSGLDYISLPLRSNVTITVSAEGFESETKEIIVSEDLAYYNSSVNFTLNKK